MNHQSPQQPLEITPTTHPRPQLTNHNSTIINYETSKNTEEPEPGTPDNTIKSRTPNHHYTRPHEQPNPNAIITPQSSTHPQNPPNQNHHPPKRTRLKRSPPTTQDHHYKESITIHTPNITAVYTTRNQESKSPRNSMPNHNHKQITTKPKLPKNHNKHNPQHQLKNQES